MRLREAIICFEGPLGEGCLVLDWKGLRWDEAWSQSASADELSVTLKTQVEETGMLLTLDASASTTIALVEVSLLWDIDASPQSRVFANGVQSWTDSREFRANERMLGLPKIFEPLYAKHKLPFYGDYTFDKYEGKKGCFHGYTYAYVREPDGSMSFWGSLSERAGYTQLRFDVSRKSLVVSKECEGMAFEGERRLLELFVAHGDDETIFDTYFAAMAIQKPKAKPAVGWTSWYYHYTNITEDIILSNLRTFVQRKIPLDIFQIDDGYQNAVGDWLHVNAKFPRGMAPLAQEIRDAGFTPGLWLAPFICEEKSLIRKENPHWLLRKRNGDLVVAGNNDGWSGLFYVLDIYHPEVREYLTRVFRTVLQEWGFRMVKLDFLYAVALIPFGGKSRGEIMCDAMDFLREVVGEHLILGCGVPLGPAFGKVDYCRIGCDVGLGWDDREPAMVHYRERISTVTAITNSIGRRHLDGRAFWNDTDVYILREESNSLSPAQRYSLFLANMIFGNVLFTSDNIANYGDASQGPMAAYASQFPILERRVHRVSFQENIYHWQPRSTLGQLFFGEHPYANIAIVEFDVKSPRGEWQPHVAAFNLGNRTVEARLPAGTWWKSPSVHGIETSLSLAPFESVCLSGEPLRQGERSHVFPGAI
jgi:alpha-galactosidase